LLETTILGATLISRSSLRLLSMSSVVVWWCSSPCTSQFAVRISLSQDHFRAPQRVPLAYYSWSRQNDGYSCEHRDYVCEESHGRCVVAINAYDARRSHSLPHIHDSHGESPCRPRYTMPVQHPHLPPPPISLPVLEQFRSSIVSYNNDVFS
jgi:hypothetical protein